LVTFFALYLKKWRKCRALPAENLANRAGIPIFEIGNVEACTRVVLALGGVSIPLMTDHDPDDEEEFRSG
jgi:hypothetical protein